MVHLPVTGNPLIDFVVLALALIGGLMWAIQGGSKLGWILVGVAGFWAFGLAKMLMH